MTEELPDDCVPPDCEPVAPEETARLVRATAAFRDALRDWLAVYQQRGGEPALPETGDLWPALTARLVAAADAIPLAWPLLAGDCVLTLHRHPEQVALHKATRVL